jgi:hypothetical protein
MDLNTISLLLYWLGYLNGSGRPARFVDSDGEVSDVFQQLTEAFDDASVKALLLTDPIGEASRVRAVMEEKVGTYFSPLPMLSHPVSFTTYSRAFMEACWEHAASLGMPLWSAFEWAAFVRARDGATITDCRWNDGGFTCDVTGTSPCGALSLMIPLGSGEVGSGEVPSATVDGDPVPVVLQNAFGWSYALVPVALDTRTPSSRTVALSLVPASSTETANHHARRGRSG